jgi:hypothetical protein
MEIERIVVQGQFRQKKVSETLSQPIIRESWCVPVIPAAKEGYVRGLWSQLA